MICRCYLVMLALAIVCYSTCATNFVAAKTMKIGLTRSTISLNLGEQSEDNMLTMLGHITDFCRRHPVAVVHSSIRKHFIRLEKSVPHDTHDFSLYTVLVVFDGKRDNAVIDLDSFSAYSVPVTTYLETGIHTLSYPRSTDSSNITLKDSGIGSTDGPFPTIGRSHYGFIDENQIPNHAMSDFVIDIKNKVLIEHNYRHAPKRIFGLFSSHMGGVIDRNEKWNLLATDIKYNDTDYWKSRIIGLQFDAQTPLTLVPSSFYNLVMVDILSNYNLYAIYEAQILVAPCEALKDIKIEYGTTTYVLPLATHKTGIRDKDGPLCVIPLMPSVEMQWVLGTDFLRYNQINFSPTACTVG